MHTRTAALARHLSRRVILSLATVITIAVGGAACSSGPECRLNADCEDGDLCTVDSCTAEGACVREPVSCDDGSFCNGAETCDPAVGCVDATPPDLDDGVDCTIDYCDDMLDMVLHEANDQRCNDDLFCNGIEVCDATAGCMLGTPTIIDDGVPCTEDVCDEATQLVTHYPLDSNCDDNDLCNGSEVCDPALDCQPGMPLVCSDSFSCTVDSCSATEGCLYVSDGTCACTNALIYSDCTDGDCLKVTDPSAADQAAQSFGLPFYQSTNNTGDFETQLATGSYDLVIVESNLGCIPATMITALTDYVNGGGRLIFGFWDLDGGEAACPSIETLRTALRVNAGPDFTTARDVYRDPLSPVDLFDSLRTLPSPLAIADVFLDDGDVLSVVDAGDYVAARFDDETGPGAIAVTRSGQVIVHGFDPFGAITGAVVDADGDGMGDVQELYINEIGLLCGI